MERGEAEKKARKAELALAMGESSRALEIYAELELARPGDGAWSHRIADIHRRRQEMPEEILALIRAADRYLAEGAHLKSLVMCKRLLELAPDLPDTERCLAALHPTLVAGSAVRPKNRDLTPVPPSPDGWMPVGAPLSEVTLTELVSPSRAEEPAWPAEISMETESIEIIAASEPAPPAPPVPPTPPTSDGWDDVQITVDSKPVAPAPTELSLEHTEPIGWSFRMTPLFAALSEPTFRRLVKKLRIVELAKNQVLFREGTRGESLFMICIGSVAVLRDKPEPLELARLDEAEFFGEIALVTDHPRNATIRALSDTLLIEIDRQMISELIYEDPGMMPVLLWFIRDRLVDTLIRTSALFSRFPYERRRALADRFKLLESQKDKALIAQGERARGLIIILSGRADVIRKMGEAELTLAQLGPGDICGEMSLLSLEPAVATVLARGHFMGLFLPADEFKQLVTDHPILVRDLERIAELRRQKLVAALEKASYSEGTLPIV